MYYALKANKKKTAKSYGRALRISSRSSVDVCKVINGKNLDKGKRFLADIMARKRNIRGKHFDNCVSAVSEMVDSAAANAEAKGLDPAKLIIHASSHKGYTFRRPRRFKCRGQIRKIASIQVVLEEK